jgi:archaellum component FlaC
MDDRKKQISELEKSNRENQAALDSLLEELGSALLSRTGTGNADTGVSPDIGEYHRLLREIADSEESIKTVEAQITRLRVLEEDIEAKEQKKSAYSKELAGFYVKMGKLILDDPAQRDFSASYRRQADVLIPKVQSLEDRLAGLKEQSEGGNVFKWIGKGAQGMVLRSFLTRAADDLERLYRNAGEQFYQARSDGFSDGAAQSADIAELGTEIEKNRRLAQALSDELSIIKEEQLKISDEFGASGGPGKQIQNLRKQIERTKEALRALYLRFGHAALRDCTEIEGGDTSIGELKILNSLISAPDREFLDKAGRIKKSIQDNEEAVKKLQASIDIDEEGIKIERYRGSIAEKKTWIAGAQRDIEEFENRIKDAEKHIEELRLI